MSGKNRGAAIHLARLAQLPAKRLVEQGLKEVIGPADGFSGVRTPTCASSAGAAPTGRHGAGAGTRQSSNQTIAIQERLLPPETD